MVPIGTKVKEIAMATENPARARIIDAAFATFGARGYEQTSMLEIATRAKVSKRELYALVGNKHDMLVACITERAGRMRPRADLPEPQDRASLTAALAALGEHVLIEVTDPVVVGVFRLAIAEAERAPETAEALDSIGRAAARKALETLFETAQARGLVSGDPADLARQFLVLLWGDLMIGLLLGLAKAPSPAEARHRARAATDALLKLQV
jgi:AcrR family transcriptional regulator